MSLEFISSLPRTLKVVRNRRCLIIGEDIGDDSVCPVLGDNIFHCHNLDEIMKEAIKDDHAVSRARLVYFIQDHRVVVYYASGPSKKPKAAGQDQVCANEVDTLLPEPFAAGE